MNKYRKKPMMVEAVQFTGSNFYEIAEQLGFEVSEDVLKNRAPFIVETREGHHTVTMRVDVGNWIIKDVKGEIYICKPNMFKATYEKIK